MTNLRMSSFTYGTITPQLITDRLLPFQIPGARAYLAEGAYGTLLFQEISAGDVTIFYEIFQIKEDLALDFYGIAGLQLYAALQNDSHYYISGIGDFYLEESHYNIISLPKIEGTRFLEGGKEYRSFRIAFSLDFLKTWRPVFHNLEEWLELDSTQQKLFFNKHPWLSKSLYDILERILDSPFAGTIQERYRNIKINEFIFLVFGGIFDLDYSFGDKVNVIIYIADDNVPLQLSEAISNSVGAFIESFGYEFETKDEPIYGSWLGRFSFFRKAGIESKIENAVEKGIKALELKYVELPTADQTQKLASAAKDLVDSLKEAEQGFVRLEAIFVMKKIVDGKTRIFITKLPFHIRKLFDDQPALMFNIDLSWQILTTNRIDHPLIDDKNSDNHKI